jgi:hypothetical protein
MILHLPSFEIGDITVEDIALLVFGKLLAISIML